jgi:tetratricopeptide (TPR) repeat protein
VRRGTEDWQGVLADLNEVLRLDPRHASAYYNRAEAYQRLGRPQEALADLDSAVGLDPGQTWNWCERGRLRARMGDAATAAADLEKCLELLPQNAPQRPQIERFLQDLRAGAPGGG